MKCETNAETKERICKQVPREVEGLHKKTRFISAIILFIFVNYASFQIKVAAAVTGAGRDFPARPRAEKRVRVQPLPRTNNCSRSRPRCNFKAELPYRREIDPQYERL
mgnify:FL=1